MNPERLVGIGRAVLILDVEIGLGDLVEREGVERVQLLLGPVALAAEQGQGGEGSGIDLAVLRCHDATDIRGNSAFLIDCCKAGEVGTDRFLRTVAVGVGQLYLALVCHTGVALKQEELPGQLRDVELQLVLELGQCVVPCRHGRAAFGLAGDGKRHVRAIAFGGIVAEIDPRGTLPNAELGHIVPGNGALGAVLIRLRADVVPDDPVGDAAPVHVRVHPDLGVKENIAVLRGLQQLALAHAGVEIRIVQGPGVSGFPVDVDFKGAFAVPEEDDGVIAPGAVPGISGGQLHADVFLEGAVGNPVHGPQRIAAGVDVGGGVLKGVIRRIDGLSGDLQNEFAAVRAVVVVHGPAHREGLIADADRPHGKVVDGNNGRPLLDRHKGPCSSGGRLAIRVPEGAGQGNGVGVFADGGSLIKAGAGNRAGGQRGFAACRARDLIPHLLPFGQIARRGIVAVEQQRRVVVVLLVVDPDGIYDPVRPQLVGVVGQVRAPVQHHAVALLDGLALQGLRDAEDRSGGAGNRNRGAVFHNGLSLHAAVAGGEPDAEGAVAGGIHLAGGVIVPHPDRGHTPLRVLRPGPVPGLIFYSPDKVIPVGQIAPGVAVCAGDAGADNHLLGVVQGNRLLLGRGEAGFLQLQRALGQTDCPALHKQADKAVNQLRGFRTLSVIELHGAGEVLLRQIGGDGQRSGQNAAALGKDEAPGEGLAAVDGSIEVALGIAGSGFAGDHMRKIGAL